MRGRYETDGNPEGEFEPGSDEQVLRNRLGISDPDEMDRIELDLLSDLQYRLYDEIEVEQRITVKDLKRWHREWLIPVYEWAGRYRSVNISKDGFPFMLADRIEAAMEVYDREQLGRWTPCDGLPVEEVARGLAENHVELILIHPFRDGNGRIARLLATVMALQAGHPPLDFTLLERDKRRYIGAIHAGMSMDYAPMTTIFGEILSEAPTG